MINLYLLMADLIWGLNIVVVKMNGPYFHPLFLICLKLLIATLSLAVYLVITHHRLINVHFKSALLDANFMNVFNFICTYFAIFLLSGCTSATLNCLSPLIMIILIFAFEHTINYQNIIFFFLGLFGFLITIQFRIGQLSLGHYLMLFGLGLYNIGNYFVKKRNIEDVLVYNFYLLFISMIEMIIVCLFTKESLIIQPVRSFYLWLMVITSGIGYAFIQSVYLLAMKQLGPIKTSFFLSLNPLFTCLFSIIILHEKVSLYEGVGFLIIVYALFLKYHFSSK